MSGVVADTVTIVWWLSDDARISPTASSALPAADDGEGIYISAVTLVHAWCATEKRTDPIPFEHLAALAAVIDDPGVNVHALPVTDQVARLAWEPDRADIPDPFDRLILATARASGMPLLSPDRSLLNQSVHPAIW